MICAWCHKLSKFYNINISEIKIWHTTFSIFFKVFTFYSGSRITNKKGLLTAHNLWKVYALPRMTYGLEVMPTTNKDKEQLEILQKKILKQTQGLPCCAANTGVYVLLGAVPVEMVIERNMLSTSGT